MVLTVLEVADFIAMPPTVLRKSALLWTTVLSHVTVLFRAKPHLVVSNAEFLLGVQEVPSSNLGSPTKFLKHLEIAIPPEVVVWSPTGVQTTGLLLETRRGCNRVGRQVPVLETPQSVAKRRRTPIQPQALSKYSQYSELPLLIVLGAEV